MHRSLLVAPLALLGLSACLAPTESAQGREETVEAVSTVTVAGGAGDVRVTGSPTATGAQLRWRMTWSDQQPTVSAELVAGTWVVETDCPLQLVCTVDLDLTVPAAADVLLENGSGDVVVRDLSGRLDASAGSGDMQLEALSGETHVDIGSGDLTGTALVATFDALVGSGDIDLTFATAANVSLETGSGDVALTVPPGTYAVSVETGSGDVSVSGVQQDPSGAVALTVQTGSGDVTITSE